MPNSYSNTHKCSDNRDENASGNTWKHFLPVKYLFLSFTLSKQQLRTEEKTKMSDVLCALQPQKTLFLEKNKRWCEKEKSASAGFPLSLSFSSCN